MNRTTFNAMLAQYTRRTVSGEGSVSWQDGVHCEIPRIVVRGAATQAKYTGKNLFDIGNVEATEPSLPTLAYISEVGDNYITISEGSEFTGNGYCTTGKTLRQLAPSIVSGETCTISFVTEYTTQKQFVFVNGSVWRIGTSKVMTDEVLDAANFVFYGYSVQEWGGEPRDARVSNIQIEAGTVATDYEPYTGGVPAPNPSYPILPQFAGEVTLTDAAGGAVTIPALLAIPDTSICDTAEYLGGESWRITRRVGVVGSYAGEAVGDVWCSSTGELSEGASVWYELETPTTETLTLGRLVQPKGAGSIEQTTGDLKCEIAVEYVGHS